MRKILRTRQSRDDYAAIYEFIAKGSLDNAASILRLFDDRLDLLAHSPLIGRPRPELSERLRSWVFHRFVIFYRPIDDGIELIRVLHGSMDIAPIYFR